MPDGWGSEKEALMRAYQQMAFTENKMMLILDIVAQYNHMTLWDYHAESDIMGRPNGIVRVGLKDNKTEQFYRVIVHMTSEWIIERMDSPIEVTEDNLLYTI